MQKAIGSSQRNHSIRGALPATHRFFRRRIAEMDRKIAGVIGAVAALGTVGGANAAAAATNPADVLKAESFADLLKPVPNATEALRAIDAAAPAPQPGGERVAQFYRHHHHHHAFYYHHHHHHRAIVRVAPGIAVVVPRRRFYHHHHHHHHSFYRRDY
jgi:hypothetical protein